MTTCAVVVAEENCADHNLHSPSDIKKIDRVKDNDVGV
jgi:hypothetical protein